jgi:deoxycytidine triphosphate deaminase
MVLSDESIRQQLEGGGIVIDPLGEGALQPSSVDLRVDRFFRVFRNDTTPYIDPKKPQEDLTELVEVPEDGAFILHPGEFVLGSTLERVALGTDLVARLEGKALALDTPVPTATGWKTIGEVEVNDEVFTPSGRPTRVVNVSGILSDQPCLEVVFSDGTTVVADKRHQWEVHTRDDRRHGTGCRVLTTDELARDLRTPSGEARYHVEQSLAVRYSSKRLPIDPYVLGVWIGDGTSTKAEITSVDEPILAQLEGAGYPVRKTSSPLAYRIGGCGHSRDPQTGRYARNGSLSSKLRDLGLLGHKHLPSDYLQASVEQRRALLEGLMDTDGYVDQLGRCDLTTVRAPLAGQYRELVASLGYRPVVASKRAMLDGRDCGPKYEVTFTPHEPVFRLPTKRARQELAIHRRQRVRTIVEIRPTRSVPVRCIEVADGRGAFLITKSFITTHNSSLGRLGLLIHSTAGFVDSGWDGHLTLELSNVANLPIAIYPGMKIGQISFLRMTTEASAPYGSEETRSKYQGQRGPTPSRYYLNFEDGDGDGADEAREPRVGEE